MTNLNIDVSYKYYNTAIKDAEIKIDENSKYVLSLVEVVPELPLEDGQLPTYNLELKYVNTITSEEVTLKMDKDGVKQFSLLFSQMMKNV